ncbi:MAG: Nramp family divalent metal transporter [Planctomycetaceae bacterium]
MNPDDPSATENIFTSLFSGHGFPQLDFTTVGILAAMAAIAGNGGLTNTPISNFTRDQGWGMGKEVGAIPSIIGGHTIQLSHVGKVFRISPETLARWTGWVRHISRDQLLIWMPACFVGIALPSMLSVQFLPHGTVLGAGDKWKAAVMTAGGVQEAVGGWGGALCWYLSLLCGFLVLVTSMVSTADGVLRRWVDVFWTALPQLRKMDTRAIGPLYFGVLCVYGTCGLLLLAMVPSPDKLLTISTNIYNYALGFSCFHVIAISTQLMPRELRPSVLRRCLLGSAGVFFLVIAVLSTYALLRA